MLKIDKAVIVEGKYDKIKLQNIIDALIIQTDGFAIFKDKDKQALIRTLAEKNGIIVITDSDSAGRVIRMHLKNIVPEGSVINVYLPQILGKEKRKDKKSAEGFLGVEGTDDKIIIEALQKFGVTAAVTDKKRRTVTKSDLFFLGLYGRENSENLRREILKYLRFPYMSANAFLDLINSLYGYENFLEVLDSWQQEQTKK